MKISFILFGGIGVFLLVVTTAYGMATGMGELAGFPLLLLTSGMGFMLWWYLRSTNKNAKEEMFADDPDGEIVQMTGNYGGFFPWSWWPVGVGAALAFFAFGLAIDWWVVLLALLPIIFFITGWVLEGNRKTYAH